VLIGIVTHHHTQTLSTGKLDIVSNDLTGTLPTNLGLLTHLSEVYLRRPHESAGHRSQLQGTLPTEIGRLAKLIALDISGTNMTGSIPTQLGQLTNLVALVLADAQFKSIPMQQLSHLTQLTKLDLNGNTQSSSQRMPAALGQLTKLRELHLNACGLTGTIPDAVGNLTNLGKI
jgi:Leucine-rich repeat (LRR) protein